MSRKIEFLLFFAVYSSDEEIDIEMVECLDLDFFWVPNNVILRYMNFFRHLPGKSPHVKANTCTVMYIYSNT